MYKVVSFTIHKRVLWKFLHNEFVIVKAKVKDGMVINETRVFYINNAV